MTTRGGTDVCMLHIARALAVICRTQRGTPSRKLLYGNEIDWTDARTNQKRLIYV